MPSKKKPKPLFEVPVELGSGRESGWVYRSGISAEEKAPPNRENTRSENTASEDNGTGIGAESAHTFALALATLAQTFVLAMTIAALPVTLGLRAFNSLSNRNESR